MSHTPQRIVRRSSSLTPSNKEEAEEKFLQWNVVTRQKFESKEIEVIEWIEQVTVKPLRIIEGRDTEIQLAQLLADGHLLCDLFRKLQPGSISSTPRRKMDRIQIFLEKCHELGVAKEELFEPEDLLERKNMVKVLYCLRSLAELSHHKRLAPFFKGSERRKKREEWSKQQETEESFLPPFSTSVPPDLYTNEDISPPSPMSFLSHSKNYDKSNERTESHCWEEHPQDLEVENTLFKGPFVELSPRKKSQLARLSYSSKPQPSEQVVSRPQSSFVMWIFVGFSLICFIAWLLMWKNSNLKLQLQHS